MLRPCDNVIIDEYLSEGESDQYEAFMSGGRHLLPSAVSLRTQRATFTALGSSLI